MRSRGVRSGVRGDVGDVRQLLDVNRGVANRAYKSFACFLPMKDLTAIKCFCQIEIGRIDFGRCHQ